MRQIRTAVVTLACGIAFAALPLSLTLDGVGSEQALAAKGGNGGGKGGGNGGGNGGGKGNGGGNSSGNGGASGKSASAAGQAKASVSKSNGKAMNAAAKPQVAAIAKQEKPTKEKNLNAKLGRLNSLNRNINAYINSKSPKFAAIQAFVTASAQSEMAQAALAEANATLAEEQAALDALNAQLDALTEGMTEEEQQASAEVAALQGQITEQEGVVAGAEQDAADAQTAADAAAVGTDDASLQAALEGMANKPVDDEVIGWAKDVLDVKIGEMRTVLETAETTEPESAETIESTP